MKNESTQIICGDLELRTVRGTWHEDVPNDIYHAMSGVSSSRLKVFLEDVREFYYQYLSGLYEKERKAHFDFGSAVHDLALLGDKLNVLEIPKDVLASNGAKSGNTWKAFEAAHDGAILLKSHEYAALHGCVEAVMNHPVAGKLLSQAGVCERAFMAHDNNLELLTRCKPDKLLDSEIVVDLKTTATGTKASKFVKNITSFGYHYQEHFYRRVLKAFGIEVKAFVFIAVQTEPPYTVDCYTLSNEFLALAEVDVENGLIDMADRLRSDDWLPRNHNSIVELSPPNYLNYKGDYSV